MIDLLEWAKFFVDVVFRGLNIAITIFLYLMVFRIYKEVTRPMHAKRGNATPSVKVFLRRLWCQHDHVARIKDPYGREYTACTHCSIDVNEGKRPEDWR